MSILDGTRFVERLHFFNGQRLFASDLQGLEAFNREMRWLHNRSLHQPGIGNGFAVAAKKGDRVVAVGPGYAIDALGREIVLTDTWTEPVPPVSGEDDGSSVFYDLAVSYPADTDLAEVETRDGVCLPRGAVRLREQPVFCWVRLERDAENNLHPQDPRLQSDIVDGLRIVLARIEVLNCQVNSAPLIAQRRNARPPQQPYIACGVAKPVAWKVWQVGSPGQLATVGLTAQIDTSSGGFLTTPCYSARIDGPRPKKTNGLFTTYVDGPINIQAATAKSFVITVLVFPLDALFGQVPIDATTFSDWGVVWMGIEG